MDNLLANHLEDYLHDKLPKAAVQALQYLANSHQWYPSVVLSIFSHWQNHQGRLSQSRLASLHNSIQLWHERITLPLLKLQQLCTKIFSADTHNLLKSALCCESFILKTQLPQFDNKKSGKLILSDLCHSLLNYSKFKRSRLNQIDLKFIYSLLVDLLPEMQHNDIQKACDEHLGSFYLQRPVSFEQLILEEL